MDFAEWHFRCPYGQWTCADGREVLFNRGYAPILERRPGKLAKPARPGEWVGGIVKEKWFFDDYSSPWSPCASWKVRRATIARVNAVLEEWGFPSLPPKVPSRRYRKPVVHCYDPSTPLPPLANPWAGEARALHPPK
jgi:hypothetical protein